MFGSALEFAPNTFSSMGVKGHALLQLHSICYFGGRRFGSLSAIFFIAQKCHWFGRKSDGLCACVSSYLLIFLTWIVAFNFQVYLSNTYVCGNTRYIVCDNCLLCM